MEGAIMSVKAVLKSRRGISPILATLLLIVIAVAAIVVTYAWIMIYMRSAGHQAGIQLNIEAVSWLGNNTDKSIKLYVRNTGTSDAEIDAVYVGTSSENLTKVDFKPDNNVVKAYGGTIEITINYTWNPLTTYYFRVVPLTGPAAEGSARSPA
ncbi:MAG: archaellin/type IV pilin N-terminal domain-containing protein [Candidatus Bathyarchaeia archaeon]